MIMAKDKLVLDADRLGYFIAWYLADDGDMGATLGETTFSAAQLAKAKPDEWAHIKATLVAGQTVGVTRDSMNGYRWESRAHAMAALRAINAALRDKSSKPWPDWAVQARGAGWKPPKGWAP